MFLCMLENIVHIQLFVLIFASAMCFCGFFSLFRFILQFFVFVFFRLKCGNMHTFYYHYVMLCWITCIKHLELGKTQSMYNTYILTISWCIPLEKLIIILLVNFCSSSLTLRILQFIFPLRLNYYHLKKKNENIMRLFLLQREHRILCNVPFTIAQ